MHILIAGCGDVGNVLAVSLLHDGHVVYGLKRDISSLPQGVQPIQADLLKPETLSNLPADIDRLVFMPTPARRDQAAYQAIFLQGWKNVWGKLKQTPVRSLLVSSTAVFGEAGGGILDEDSVPNPTGFNGKILLEMEQLAARSTENLVVARISGIYGPGRERLISLSTSKGLEIQKTPPQFTNRIHRDDAAAALKHLLDMENPQSLYLLTDNLPAPRYDVVEWLAKAQGYPAPGSLVDEHANLGKRVINQRLRDSGFKLSYPDYRSGYGALLKNRADLSTD